MEELLLAALDLVVMKFESDKTDLRPTAPVGQSDHGMIPFVYGRGCTGSPDKWRKLCMNVNVVALHSKAIT